nr:DNA-directed RNA polymerase subunit delta [Amphibacillus sp. MSJ-3]
MIELAILVLEDHKKALNYREIYDRVSEMKGFSQAEKEEYLAQFYTDLNLDGRFLTLGSGEWGLKKWYSVDQIDEVITVETTPKKRKKKKKVTKEELEPSIDDQDDDLTEVPLDLVDVAYKNDDEEDEDMITLNDDLIDEEDYDEEDYEDEDELDDEEEEEDEDEFDRK